jgi:hypothetical protein
MLHAYGLRKREGEAEVGQVGKNAKERRRGVEKEASKLLFHLETLYLFLFLHPC